MTSDCRVNIGTTWPRFLTSDCRVNIGITLLTFGPCLWYYADNFLTLIVALTRKKKKGEKSSMSTQSVTMTSGTVVSKPKLASSQISVSTTDTHVSDTKSTTQITRMWSANHRARTPTNHRARTYIRQPITAGQSWTTCNWPISVHGWDTSQSSLDNHT